MGYKQCNGDHTVFYRHSNCQITILAVYVDDIIITGDDDVEISRLKKSLSKEFEVKDLGQLKYFLGIEIARSPKGIVLSQGSMLSTFLVIQACLGVGLLQHLLTRIISYVLNLGNQWIRRSTRDLLEGSSTYVIHDPISHMQ